MQTILAETIDYREDPIVTVDRVLELIAQMKDKLGIPFFKAYVKATGGLQRKGVSFVVTLEQAGEQELVPIRVKNAETIRTLHCTKEDLISWKRKFIHPINTRYCRTIADVLRKVESCLKTSLHRFISRIQKTARTRGIQLKPGFARRSSNREPYRRPSFQPAGQH
ncbi:MAG TPA: hypothetical protein VL335_00790 [Candidatus Paceibacterota bacterium]|jgi:hypothetical protein|nr:hypothetical protein [Candidatus Paceibacterota bacterium]